MNYLKVNTQHIKGGMVRFYYPTCFRIHPLEVHGRLAVRLSSYPKVHPLETPFGQEKADLLRAWSLGPEPMAGV